MECYKCGSTRSGIYYRTVPVGQVNNNWECDECKNNLPPLPELEPTCKGETYKERCDYQLEEWVKGNPIHNTTDNECCPDFSCCNPDKLQPKEIRETFLNANEEQRESMLFTFLINSLPSNIHIVNGKDEINKDLN